MKINYQSEFKIIEHGNCFDGVTPFRYTYFTPKSNLYIASFDGTRYVNCRSEADGELLVVFENHALSIGELKVIRELYLTDSDFARGVCKSISLEDTTIELTTGKSEGSEVTVELLERYACGESAYDIACRNGFEGSEQEWLDSLVSGGVSAATQVVSDFDSSTSSMQPNIYYCHTAEADSITITLADSDSTSTLSEYMLTFTTGQSVPTLTYPDSVVWVGCVDDSGVPELSASKSYEVNIVGGRGVIIEW